MITAQTQGERFALRARTSPFEHCERYGAPQVLKINFSFESYRLTEKWPLALRRTRSQKSSHIDSLKEFTNPAADRAPLYCFGWILSASFMKSSRSRRCLKVPTFDPSGKPTSLQQIEGTMKHSHQARGSGYGKAMASVAAL